jgi:hypothetical protein
VLETATQIRPENCPIKGNINPKGEKIYHAPWSKHYARTRVDLSKGERLSAQLPRPVCQSSTRPSKGAPVQAPFRSAASFLTVQAFDVENKPIEQ